MILVCFLSCCSVFSMLLAPAPLGAAEGLAQSSAAASAGNQAAQATAPAAAPGKSGGTAQSSPAAPMLVDIALERRSKEGKVEPMAAGHVFQTGDIVRLRLKSHYDGFLYVLNQGTTGRFSTIFPGVETGASNRVRANQQYLVPAVEDGWFEVEGPAGFDILYFLLSPTPLASPPAAAFAAPGPASSLRPRCNDEIFKARGECTDDSAGPAALPLGTAIPAPLVPLAPNASRDLVFVDEAEGAVGVSNRTPAANQAVPAPSAPVLYTFRLAHQ